MKNKNETGVKKERNRGTTACAMDRVITSQKINSDHHQSIQKSSLKERLRDALVISQPDIGKDYPKKFVTQHWAFATNTTLKRVRLR